ncbi:auxin-regulated protein involved in organ size [Musa troglodytarum]|uniref:Auxin-regulated protein involved in organ size n=1 Tax=Musa troglodytarum TaxID=320322 RepID=A0A9E7ED96_9LILI|nr:auxin-regulated protein involved in organ size [Musa troglodytarum]
MEGRTRRSRSAMASNIHYRRSLSQASELGAPPFAAYFTVESLLLLLFLTASLLILPLVLPPLPPPPSLLLLLPVGLLGVLVFLAFMPSDARKIASSHL